MDDYEAKYLERITNLEGDIRFYKQKILDLDDEIRKEQKWAKECMEADRRGVKQPLLNDWESQAKATYMRVDSLINDQINYKKKLEDVRAELRDTQLILENSYGYDYRNYVEPDAYPSFSESLADLKDFGKKVKENYKPNTLKKALIISFAYAVADIAVLLIADALYMGNLVGLLVTVAGPIAFAVIASKALFSSDESRKGAKTFIVYGLGLAITISTMFKFSMGLVVRTAVFCIIASLLLERITGAKG